MATISFDEKVVVKDKKTIERVTKHLDDIKPVSMHRYSDAPVCNSKSTIDNAKKWNL